MLWIHRLGWRKEAPIKPCAIIELSMEQTPATITEQYPDRGDWVNGLELEILNATDCNQLIWHAVLILIAMATLEHAVSGII